MRAHSSKAFLASLIIAALVFLVDKSASEPLRGSNGGAIQTARAWPPLGADDGSNTSMTVYKEPSSWIVTILRELFDDIDWQTIDDARVQIEKFIHKVDRIIGSFRTILSKATGGSKGEPAEASPRDGRSLASRWWSSSKAAPPGSDATSVKEMLERVACFVGYTRLMNLSNEALAELDAAKAVTNLFGSSGKRNSSAWSLFG